MKLAIGLMVAVLFFVLSIENSWNAPAIATIPLPHHANPVKPICVPTLYRQPASGGAMVRHTAPADAARPLTFPRVVGAGAASLSIMRRTGYARMDVKLRIVRHTQILGYSALSGTKAR